MILFRKEKRDKQIDQLLQISFVRPVKNRKENDWFDVTYQTNAGPQAFRMYVYCSVAYLFVAK